MARDDHSVGQEPHLKPTRPEADESEARAERVLRQEARNKTRTEEIEHSVWEEPALSGPLVRAVSQLSEYGTWLAERRLRSGRLRSWMVTLGAALVAGPFAVLGVLLGSGAQTMSQLLAVVLIGPVAEEVMKNAVPLFIVEKRPYLFRSRLQIGLCALGSGLAFAAIENVMYLRVYAPEPSTLLTQWRWSVCVVLHMGCALIYALGLMRIWHDVWQRRARPRLELGLPYAVAAIALHGTYNGIVTLLELTRFDF